MPQISDVLAQLTAEQFEDRAKHLAPVDTGYLVDHIVTDQVAPGAYKVESQAGYSGFQEFGFQHYRDGFIPGKFFFTGALNYCLAFLEQGGAAQIVRAEMVARIEPPSDD